MASFRPPITARPSSRSQAHQSRVWAHVWAMVWAAARRHAVGTLWLGERRPRFAVTCVWRRVESGARSAERGRRSTWRVRPPRRAEGRGTRTCNSKMDCCRLTLTPGPPGHIRYRRNQAAKSLISVACPRPSRSRRRGDTLSRRRTHAREHARLSRSTHTQHPAHNTQHSIGSRARLLGHRLTRVHRVLRWPPGGSEAAR